MTTRIRPLEAVASEAGRTASIAPLRCDASGRGRSPRPRHVRALDGPGVAPRRRARHEQAPVLPGSKRPERTRGRAPPSPPRTRRRLLRSSLSMPASVHSFSSLDGRTVPEAAQKGSSNSSPAHRSTNWIAARLERIRRPAVVPAPGEVVPAGRKAVGELGEVGLAHGSGGVGVQVGEHRDGLAVDVELEASLARPARCRSPGRQRSRSRSRTACWPGTSSASRRLERSRFGPPSGHSVRGRDGDDDECSHDDLLSWVSMARECVRVLKDGSRGMEIRRTP